MTAKVKSMIQSVVVLCVIALASGLILGLFNKLTWVDPQKDVLDKFATLSGTNAKFEMLDKDNGQTYFFAKAKKKPRPTRYTSAVRAVLAERSRCTSL